MSDHFVNNVTNQRGYSWLLKFLNGWFFFFFVCTFMTVYQCTSNVLICIQWSTHWLCWHCFLNLHFNSHPTLYVSHGRRHMMWRPDICQNVSIDIEKTMIKNVFMGWYSMVYYLSKYCMCILFPKIMMGMISWCFYQKPESLQCRYEISITDFDFTFFSLLLVCIFPWSVFGYVFTVLLSVALQAFFFLSWDTTDLEAQFWEKTWVGIQLKRFSKPTSSGTGLSSSTEGLIEHFNPGQCWSHGGGVTC